MKPVTREQYDSAWMRVIDYELAEGRTPQQIGDGMKARAEFSIDYAWRMQHIPRLDGRYAAIRAHFPDPREAQP